MRRLEPPRSARAALCPAASASAEQPPAPYHSLRPVAAGTALERLRVSKLPLASTLLPFAETLAAKAGSGSAAGSASSMPVVGTDKEVCVVPLQDTPSSRYYSETQSMAITGGLSAGGITGVAKAVVLIVLCVHALHALSLPTQLSLTPLCCCSADESHLLPSAMAVGRACPLFDMKSKGGFSLEDATIGFATVAGEPSPSHAAHHSHCRSRSRAPLRQEPNVLPRDSAAILGVYGGQTRRRSSRAPRSSTVRLSAPPRSARPQRSPRRRAKTCPARTWRRSPVRCSKACRASVSHLPSFNLTPHLLPFLLPASHV